MELAEALRQHDVVLYLLLLGEGHHLLDAVFDLRLGKLLGREDVIAQTAGRLDLVFGLYYVDATGPRRLVDVLSVLEPHYLTRLQLDFGTVGLVSELVSRIFVRPDVVAWRVSVFASPIRAPEAPSPVAVATLLVVFICKW